MESLHEVASAHAPELATAVSSLAGAIALWVLQKLLTVGWNFVKYLREGDLKKIHTLSSTIEKIAETLQANTAAINSLNKELKWLGDRIIETDKFTILQEMSHERLVAVVREMAGPKWSEIQEKVAKDQFVGSKK